MKSNHMQSTTINLNRTQTTEAQPSTNPQEATLTRAFRLVQNRRAGYLVRQSSYSILEGNSEGIDPAQRKVIDKAIEAVADEIFRVKLKLEASTLMHAVHTELCTEYAIEDGTLHNSEPFREATLVIQLDSQLNRTGAEYVDWDDYSRESKRQQEEAVNNQHPPAREQLEMQVSNALLVINSSPVFRSAGLQLMTDENLILSMVNTNG